jgi:glycine/D-amino acid oxidase-like deaminating enzyme
MRSSVGWDDDPVVAAWPGLPQLPGDVSTDACVVGLGASGLAAVAALVGRGLSVVGVDAGRVAAFAAGRNGGFLIAGPEAALHRAIEAWGVDDAVGLYRATLNELRWLRSELGDEIVRPVGSIRLAGLPGDAGSDIEAADREAELADCAAQRVALEEHGVAVEDYDGPLGRGLYLPDDAATNPARRALELASRLRGQAQLHEGTRVRTVTAGQVVTTAGTVFARHVVVAVDGRLELLLPQLDGVVRTARLQMLATSPIESGRLSCPVYGRWGYDYAQQAPDGRLFVGGGRDLHLDTEWTADPHPTAEVQAYIEAVAARMAGGSVGVTHRWAAPVGFTDDERAVVMQVDDGVVACGGYSGTGNLVGPVAARAAVDLLLDGTRPPAYFRADR